jgi:pimeloyl-[acyl-carrier protein] methyl ester esterase
MLETQPGVHLHWHEEGAGRPVVLVHGWSMSSRALGGLARSLAPSRRALALDLRGHGASSAPVDGYAVEDHARDLAAWMERLDLDGAALVGWSMGAQIALEALPAVERRVDRLVLMSMTPRFTAAPDWPHGLPESTVRALALRLERGPERTLRRFFDGMFAPDELEPGRLDDLAAEILAGGPSVAPVAARRGLDALVAADQRDRLPSVRVPTLLVHGDRDAICLPAASAHAEARIARARRCVLSGAGHAPHLSRPAAVLDLLRGFVEGAA